MQSGQAMIVSVVAFLGLSLSIVSGLVSPSIRELKIANDSIRSKQSLFLSESGIEDAFYRLKTGKTIGSSNTITLGANSVTTTVANSNINEKIITATGNVSSRQRRSQLTVSAGTGLSFSYGIQAGEWGFRMENSSFVDGSIYSNGPVTGTGTSDVTGSVTSANTAASVADQENGSGTPTYNLIFGRHGDSNSSEDIAQSFVINTTGPLNNAQIYLKKVGHPSNSNVYILHNINGEPDNTRDYLAKGVLSASLVSTSYGWVTVTFDAIPNMIAGQTYWMVIESNNDNNNYYIVGANNTFSTGSALIGNYHHDHEHHNNSWDPVSPSNADLFFKIYLDGITGLIDNINVGKNGTANAYAHRVINSSITGTNYCQTGSSNNRACNTSLADPVPQAMPISQQNIQDWKDDALAGGVINGNYTPGGHGVTLGPKKINGTLHLDDNDILTLTGTIWVTGDLIIDRHAIVEPSSSYTSSSVAVIVDGRISIGSSAEFTSGNSHSYVLALSTSNCPFGPTCNGHDAIELRSRVEAVILYAADGIIDIRNRAKARQMTAYGIDLGSDSDLIYDSGLISQNFISGPSGGWNVSGWGEI